MRSRKKSRRNRSYSLQNAFAITTDLSIHSLRLVFQDEVVSRSSNSAELIKSHTECQILFGDVGSRVIGMSSGVVNTLVWHPIRVVVENKEGESQRGCGFASRKSNFSHVHFSQRCNLVSQMAE